MSGFSDFLTTDTSPWWVAIATGFGGAGLTGWFARRQQKDRDADELARRWDTDLRGTSARFMAAEWDLQRKAADRIRGEIKHGDERNYESSDEALYEMSMDAYKILAELIVVGPDDMAGVGTELEKAAADWPRKNGETDEQWLDRYQDRFAHVFAAFTTACRRHFKVSDEVPVLRPPTTQ